MTTLKVALRNFKTHDFLEIDFNGINALLGRTGQGKTSILEAMIFALYGRDFYGGIGADRFIKQGESETIVVLTIGKIEVKRILGKNGMEIFIDDNPATQAEIDMLFGSREVVLPSLNPFYLMQMSDAEKRAVFMKFLPQLDKKKIFVEKYGEELLEQYTVSSYKGVRSEKKELSDLKKANGIEIRTLKSQTEVDKQAVLELSKELVDNPKEGDTGKRDELQEKLRTVSTALARFGDLEQEHINLSEKCEAAKNTIREILEKQGQSKLSLLVAKLEAGVSEQGRTIEKAKAKYQQAKTLVGIYSEVVGSGICKICGQKFDANSAEKRKEGLEIKTRQIKELIERLEADGIVSRFELKEIYELSDRVKALMGQLAGIEENLENFRGLQVKEAGLKKSLESGDSQKNEDHIRAKAQIEIIENRIEKADSRVKKLEKQVEDVAPRMSELDVLEMALSPSGVNSVIAMEQAKQLNKLITVYKKGMRIETIRANKTNPGHKEVFALFYTGMGRDFEVPFSVCSFGERLQASVILSIVLQKLIEGSATHHIPVLLLDEASVFSKAILSSVQNYCVKSKTVLIYTKIAEKMFAVESKSWHGKD